MFENTTIYDTKPAPIVLDLLGLDNPQSTTATSDLNGNVSADGNGTGASANGQANNGNAAAAAATGKGNAGDAKVLMLTDGGLAPSMMGPVGAARGAGSELAVLAGEVRGWKRGRRGVRVTACRWLNELNLDILCA